MRRPSHDFLMKAQGELRSACSAESAAGNDGAAMVLNDMIVSIFQIVLSAEFDDLANAAYRQRYGQVERDNEASPLDADS